MFLGGSQLLLGWKFDIYLEAREPGEADWRDPAGRLPCYSSRCYNYHSTVGATISVDRFHLHQTRLQRGLGNRGFSHAGRLCRSISDRRRCWFRLDQCWYIQNQGNETKRRSTMRITLGLAKHRHRFPSPKFPDIAKRCIFQYLTHKGLDATGRLVVRIGLYRPFPNHCNVQQIVRH